MLHRDNREIVNTGDHLTIRQGRDRLQRMIFRARSARPKPVLHPCANVPCRNLGRAKVEMWRAIVVVGLEI